MKNIVSLLKEGKTPDQMVAVYPSLSLAQVHAALAYYYDNPDEIQAALEEEVEWEARHEEVKAAYTTRRKRG